MIGDSHWWWMIDHSWLVMDDGWLVNDDDACKSSTRDVSRCCRRVTLELIKRRRNYLGNPCRPCRLQYPHRRFLQWDRAAYIYIPFWPKITWSFLLNEVVFRTRGLLHSFPGKVILGALSFLSFFSAVITSTNCFRQRLHTYNMHVRQGVSCTNYCNSIQSILLLIIPLLLLASDRAGVVRQGNLHFGVPKRFWLAGDSLTQYRRNTVVHRVLLYNIRVMPTAVVGFGTVRPVPLLAFLKIGSWAPQESYTQASQNKLCCRCYACPSASQCAARILSYQVYARFGQTSSKE